MIVLGFDTATPSTAVGLRLADGTILQARDDPEGGRRPGHATRLLPLVDGLLGKAGIGWSELDRIAVGVGPGTFTGLRIGIATARGLAQSLGVELVGISSLRALAFGGARVLAVIDARRAEVFVAAYDGERELLTAQAVRPDGLAELLQRTPIDTSAEEWTALGDGAVHYRASLEQVGASVPPDGSERHRIQASAICELGCRRPDSACVATVVPDYRRRPDAEIALEGAASR
jgi:tRNA threonylcarbamoyladenosine biosynthesis protein TsaB